MNLLECLVTGTVRIVTLPCRIVAMKMEYLMSHDRLILYVFVGVVAVIVACVVLGLTYG
jgi:hypothetical protein